MVAAKGEEVKTMNPVATINDGLRAGAAALWDGKTWKETPVLAAEAAWRFAQRMGLDDSFWMTAIAVITLQARISAPAFARRALLGGPASPPTRRPSSTPWRACPPPAAPVGTT